MSACTTLEDTLMQEQQLENKKEEKDQPNITLDINNVMDEMIGEKDGLPKKTLDKLNEEMPKINKMIWNKLGPGSNFLGFLSLPYQSDELIENIITTANRLARISDIFIVLGIGGSYLGAQALYQALMPTYYNELPREKRNRRPRIYFDGNNIDTNSINDLLSFLPDETPKGMFESFSINVISKSGSTIETAVAFRILQQKAKQIYQNNHNKYIIATTDAQKGSLKNIAEKEGYETFVIPDNVGGRYSVLSPVGLFPCAVIGINIKELLAGARNMASRCKSDNIWQNPAYLYAAVQYLFYKEKKKNISLLVSWLKSLESFGMWYDQLCAESIGKNGIGRVPINSINTRDLHSRGQEIQEGERNTVITNIIVKDLKKNILLPHDEEDIDGLNYIALRNLHDLSIEGAYEGTSYAYTKDQRPNLTITLPKLNEYTLGQLIFILEVATVAEGYLLSINPLDQPGVENYKNFMFGILGHKDKKKFKDEFDSRKKPRKEYII